MCAMALQIVSQHFVHKCLDHRPFLRASDMKSVFDLVIVPPLTASSVRTYRIHDGKWLADYRGVSMNGTENWG